MVRRRATAQLFADKDAGVDSVALQQRDDIAATRQIRDGNDAETRQQRTVPEAYGTAVWEQTASPLAECYHSICCRRKTIRARQLLHASGVECTAADHLCVGVKERVEDEGRL